MSFKGSKDVKELGGKKIDVIYAPRIKRGNTIKEIPGGLKSLLTGMKITFSYVSRPSTIITQQYPENRNTLKMFDRYRAQLVMKYNEDGFHNCTACKICERACPNGSIKVEAKKGKSGKLEIQRYIWRFDTCTFCNECVTSCPFDAIEMGGNFETAVYDRRLLVFVLNKYAGPPASFFKKLEEGADPKEYMEPVGRFDADVPLAGKDVPGNPAHVVRPVLDADAPNDTEV